MGSIEGNNIPQLKSVDYVLFKMSIKRTNASLDASHLGYEYPARRPKPANYGKF